MRRQSREIALQVLFQLEFAPQISIQQLLNLFEDSIDEASISYAEELITGVMSNKSVIDDKIQSLSRNWKLDRMAAVDRNVLRFAAYELLFSKNPLSPGIVIDEAIEIAKKFGTTDSGSFVNGILDQMAKESGKK